jgi:hypothetical protein
MKKRVAFFLSLKNHPLFLLGINLLPPSVHHLSFGFFLLSPVLCVANSRVKKSVGNSSLRLLLIMHAFIHPFIHPFTLLFITRISKVNKDYSLKILFQSFSSQKL